MVRSENRLNSLDSLRGLAAVYVVFFHLLLVPSPNLIIPNPIANHIVLFGGTGVFLFFIISGFSLAMTMPNHDRARHPLVSYWLRRIFRIAPLFYVMIVVSALRDQWYFGSHPSLAKLAVNVTFLFNFFPKQQEGIVWASWTIGVEMLFYVLFPAIYRLSTVLQCGLAVAVTMLFEVVDSLAPVYFYWSLLGYLPMFIIGVLSFKIYTRLKDHPRRLVFGVALAVAASTMLLACAMVTGAEKNIHLRELIAIGYGGLVIGCLLLRPRLLENRLPFFGAISYSLYLVHAPIIYGCSPLFHAITVTLPNNISYPVCAAVAICLTVPTAWVIWRYIEKPSDEFGRRLNNRRLAAFT